MSSLDGTRAEDLLCSIEGEQLSSVTFVQNYVQLHFDGPYITAFTLPVVAMGDVRVDIRDSTYRNRLCEQIAKCVKSARVFPEDRLEIQFTDSTMIMISLREEDRRGPESALFDNKRLGLWEVW